MERETKLSYLFDKEWQQSFRNGRDNDDDCSCVSISIYFAFDWLYKQYLRSIDHRVFSHL